ncbi:hypothetical protein M2427_007541 [Bradyrhizobium sp. BR13661]|jgi:hypothetical protein|nr:hypothetical protein [Bradyrhizobium sp. BR13661]
MWRVALAIAVVCMAPKKPARASELIGDNAAFVAKLAGGLYATMYCGDLYEMDRIGFVRWADGHGVDVEFYLPKFAAGASAYIGWHYDRKDLDPRVTRLIRKVFGGLDDMKKGGGSDEACRSVVRSSIEQHFIKKRGVAL